MVGSGHSGHSKDSGNFHGSHDFHGTSPVETLEKSKDYVVERCDPASGVSFFEGDLSLLEAAVAGFHPHALLFDCAALSFHDRHEDHKGGMDKGGIGMEKTTLFFLFETIRQRWRRLPSMILFSNDPGAETKADCIAKDMHYIVAPFSFLELDLRFKAMDERQRMLQHGVWQDRRLKNAVAHIDNLKERMTLAEKRYNREKGLLHNSLKQINEMTRERENLRQEIRERRIALSDTVKGLFDFLSSAIESRNETRRGHTRRVTEIALFVADRIGLDDTAKKDLKRAAMLHEVGRLMIPDHVLDRPLSALSRFERDMVDLHFHRGATYLEKCPGFQKTADIIRHLNENADGTGFPDGLKKRYIPLLSRILTGADELDQLWMDHCSESSQSEHVVETLMAALEDRAGARIDPAVVNYLEKYVVTVLGQNRIQLRELSVSQLEPGMVIGTGLFTRTGTKLLTPGTRLTRETIDMMIRYNREYPVDETVFIKVE